MNAIPNVQINNETSYKAGTEVEYQCDIGYTDSVNKLSNSKIVCMENGKWSETNLKCLSMLFFIILIVAIVRATMLISYMAKPTVIVYVLSWIFFIQLYPYTW